LNIKINTFLLHIASASLLLFSCTKSFEPDTTSLSSGASSPRVSVVSPRVVADPLGGAPEVAIYGGGPFYSSAEAVRDSLTGSGFNTAILWSFHTNTNGDIIFNDTKIISNGQYIGNPSWVGIGDYLKANNSGIKMVVVSMGGYDCSDFTNIAALTSNGATADTGILYRNFKVLLNVTKADMIDYDEEDVAFYSPTQFNSLYKFSVMLHDLGFAQLSFCPYYQDSFYTSVQSYLKGVGLGSFLTTIHFQYYGGHNTDPSTLASIYPGERIVGGLWCKNNSQPYFGKSPSDMVNYYRGFGKDTTFYWGAFVWSLDDIFKMQAQNLSNYTVSNYGNTLLNFLSFVKP